MLRAAIYCRVSTEDQAQDGLSIPAQRRVLLEYASTHGMKVVAEYVDEGVSARTPARPQFQLMIRAARSHPRPFDVILVHKTDRFARNREDAIICKALLRRECGVEVISVSEQFDETPTGRLLEGLMEVIAEFFSLNLSQEVRKGMKEKALHGGKVLGRLPFGYRATPDGSIAVVPEEAEVVRFIFHQYATGENSLAEIARKVHSTYGSPGLKWSTSTIRNTISNQFYLGTLVWNRRQTRGTQRQLRSPEEWVVVENSHPPIVSPEVFQRANQVLSQRARCGGRKPQRDYLLKGLMFCMHCGSPMCSNTISWKLKHGAVRTKQLLSCSGYHNGNGCYYNHVEMDLVEGHVIQIIRETFGGFFQASDLSFADLSLEMLQNKRSQLEERLKNIETRFQRQFEAYSAGLIDIDQLKQARTSLEEERLRLLAQLEQCSAPHSSSPPRAGLEQVMTRAKALLELMDDGRLPIPVRRSALKHLISRVEYSREKHILRVVLTV